MALLMALCLLLPAPPAEAGNVGDSLLVGIQSTKTTAIRPLNPVERDIQSVYSLVYEGLISIDDNYLPQPCLAESWEIGANGRTWTFRLRKGLTFSDGSPLTASDVVATANYILQRAQDENTVNRGYYRNLNYFVNKISASGDDMVVVRTTSSRGYYGLLYAMTFPVLPASEVDMDDPLGSGPYIIESFTLYGSIRLEANTNWWKNQPAVKHIIFQMSSTASQVIEDYEYARVDAAFTRSISAAQYKSGTRTLALDCRTNQLEVLQLNQNKTKLKSLNVRKAIRAAVDVDKIASNVYMGMVARTDTPMIPGTWMYNDNLDSYFVTDVNYARSLLAEDGWGDANDDGTLDKLIGDELISLEMELLVYEEPDNNVRIATANAIADQLKALGITITVTTVTMTQMQEKLSAGSFTMALVSYAVDVVPDPGYFLISRNSGNHARYSSERMDNLCKELRTTLDQSSYQQKLMDIQTLFAEDCPFICMFYRSGVVMTRMMYTTARDIRELELLRGIEEFRP